MTKILITGCHRSGTSLIQALMNYFEDTYVFPSELHPYEPLRKEENKPVIVRKMPQGKYYPHHYLPRHMRDKGDFTDTHHRIRTLEDLILKENWNIIYMIRDARDVLVSKHGVNKNKYWSVPWKWIKSIENAINLIHSGWDSGFLPIKYEDLVINPENIMNRISKWIGKKYNNDYINFYKNVNPQSEMGKAMKNVRSIDKNSIGNWKRKEHAIRIHNIMTGPDGRLIKMLLKRLGYKDVK